MVTKKSGERPLSRPGQSADWPARGRLRQQSSGLDWGRAADYSLEGEKHPRWGLYLTGRRGGGVLLLCLSASKFLSMERPIFLLIS